MGFRSISVRRFAPWQASRSSRDELGRGGSGAQAAVLLRAAAHRAVWVFGIVVMICAQVGRTRFEQRFDGVPLPASTAPLSVVLLGIVLCFGAGWALLSCSAPAAAWLRSAERCTSIRRCGSGSHCW